jgi:NADH-quinone oxidoreductase subunit N
VIATAVTQLPAQFVPATLNYAALLPMLIVFGFALIGVLVEAFVPRTSRYAVQVAITLIALVGAFLAVVLVAVNHQTSTAGLAEGAGVKGSVVIDGPALFLQGAVLVLSFMGVLTMAERLGGVGSDAFTPMGAATPGSGQEALATRAGLATSEVFPLALFSIGGMMLFPAAGDLITMFVALEVLSLPLYILVGLSRRRRLLSQEASLKYFLLGSFSSAFFLFGTALLFG